MPSDFALPDLGEGIEEADVLKIYVKEGDSLTVDQPVMEIETDKATLDVPSGIAGTITGLHVAEGQTITPGTVLITVLEGAGAESGDAPPAAAPSPPAAPPVTPAAPPATTPAAPPATPADPPRVASTPPPDREAPASMPEDLTQRAVFASPSVRRFAREIGVDVRAVAGSGPAGRISQDDVKRFARAAGGAPAPVPSGAPAPPPPLPDFSRWGPIEREPLSRFRRTVARNMSLAWEQIPAVTLHHTADVTDLETMRQRYKQAAIDAGGRLTVTAILLKVVASALRAHPRVNASYDAEAQELVLKDYIHIGVAVDTDRGLVVPVIRDADRKNIIQLGVELTELSAKARDNELTIEEMRGSSFTVTNLGRPGDGALHAHHPVAERRHPGDRAGGDGARLRRGLRRHRRLLGAPPADAALPQLRPSRAGRRRRRPLHDLDHGRRPAAADAGAGGLRWLSRPTREAGGWPSSGRDRAATRPRSTPPSAAST